ncbi:MAG TPA: hypothetical protein VFS30_04875 [Dehalococcoidia bacterium]|nr:hypothetical protein [Dehalococcoidia bacterium]
MANATRSIEIGPGRIETVDRDGVTVATANVDGHNDDPGGARSEVVRSGSIGVFAARPSSAREDGSQFDRVRGNVLRAVTAGVRTYLVHEDEGELKV